MADNFENWPAMVDDDGSLSVGTVPTKALFDAIRASIAATTYSSTNPDVFARMIIDEVVAARGGSANVDARLDAMGLLITAAGAPILSRVSAAINSTLAAENGHTYSMPPTVLSADYKQIEIIAAGAFANNANNKSIKLYAGTNVLTLIVDNAAIANNKWTIHGFLTRITAASSVFDGIVTFHSASAAPPTIWHISAALAGGATNFAAVQDIKLFMLAPTADVDIVIARCTIRYLP